MWASDIKHWAKNIYALVQAMLQFTSQIYVTLFQSRHPYNTNKPVICNTGRERSKGRKTYCKLSLIHAVQVLHLPLWTFSCSFKFAQGWLQDDANMKIMKIISSQKHYWFYSTTARTRFTPGHFKIIHKYFKIVRKHFPFSVDAYTFPQKDIQCRQCNCFNLDNKSFMRSNSNTLNNFILPNSEH